MANRASEKIIDALTQLIEGFNELQESLENDYEEHEDNDENDDDNYNSEMEAGLVSEMHTALDAVIDSEDATAEELATLFSVMNEALEEIDPSVFEESEEDEDDDEVYGDDDEDYEDYDEDEDDLDDYDDDEDYEDYDDEDEDDDDDE